MRNDTGWRKTVGGGCVAVGESSGEYEQIVIDSWLIVAICGSKFSSVVRMTATNRFWVPNYMGEVSRLLIASSRLRLMETFMLNVFST